MDGVRMENQMRPENLGRKGDTLRGSTCRQFARSICEGHVVALARSSQQFQRRPLLFAKAPAAYGAISWHERELAVTLGTDRMEERDNVVDQRRSVRLAEFLCSNLMRRLPAVSGLIGEARAGVAEQFQKQQLADIEPQVLDGR